MSKYIKYIVALVLVIVCIFLVWYIFFRENQEIVQYMEKFNETVEVVNKQTDNNNNENVNDSENDANIDKEAPPENVDKPVIDNPQNVDKETSDGGKHHGKESNRENGKKEDNNETVILTSETEMLNKKGEELLKELSKELEDSLLTIQESTGVVDSDILDKDQEL